MSDEAVSVEVKDIVAVDETVTMKEKNKPKALLMRKAALLAYTGSSCAEIAEQLGVTANTIAKWLASPFCSDLMNTFSNSDREYVKESLAEAIEPMCARLREDIQNNTPNCYDAIKIVSKIYGLTEKAERREGLKTYTDLLATLVGSNKEIEEQEED